MFDPVTVPVRGEAVWYLQSAVEHLTGDQRESGFTFDSKTLVDALIDIVCRNTTAVCSPNYVPDEVLLSILVVFKSEECVLNAQHLGY